MRTPLSVLAALAAAGTALLLLRPAGRILWTPEKGRARDRGRLLPASGLSLLAAGTGAVLAVASLSGTHVTLLAIGGAVGAGVHRLAGKARAERRAAARRERVVDFCEALVGELQAGQPASLALQRAVTVWPATEPVAAAVDLGADVPNALRRAASDPGAGQLRRLAAAWQLCSATGSGLSLAAEQVLETARAEQAAARRVASELASARATARLVAILPVVVLVAAQSIGARPWHFLLSTPAGLVCLASGSASALAGLAWIDRIAHSATGDGT
jgi:tight adherence protein B